MTSQQLLCGLLRRHDFRVTWDDNRLYEQCVNCERQRPGWLIDVDPKLQDQKAGLPRVIVTRRTDVPHRY